MILYETLPLNQEFFPPILLQHFKPSPLEQHTCSVIIALIVSSTEHQKLRTFIYCQIEYAVVEARGFARAGEG